MSCTYSFTSGASSIYVGLSIATCKGNGIYSPKYYLWTTPVKNFILFVFPPLRQGRVYQYSTRLYAPAKCRQLHNTIYSQKPIGFQERYYSFGAND